MLEIYRSCPRCKSHVQVDQQRCKCGQKLGAALGQPEAPKWRRVLDGIALALVLAVVAAGVARPDWYQAVAGGRALADVATLRQARPAWSGIGLEPPARVWAWKLEANLRSSCSQTWHQLADKKMVSGMLNFQLVGGTLEASKKAQQAAKAAHEKIPWMTPEEVQDGAAAVGRLDDFVNVCLVRGYAVLEPCEKFKDALGTAAAADCLVPPVQRMLGSLAWQVCSAHAQEPRVKTLCRLAAERMDAAPQPAGATGM